MKHVNRGFESKHTHKISYNMQTKNCKVIFVVYIWNLQIKRLMNHNDHLSSISQLLQNREPMIQWWVRYNFALISLLPIITSLFCYHFLLARIVVLYNWTNLNPLNSKIFCTKFHWNWLNSWVSKENPLIYD